MTETCHHGGHGGHGATLVRVSQKLLPYKEISASTVSFAVES